MNSNYTEFKFPQIKACLWKKVFRSKTPEDAISFVGGMLAYSPSSRVLPLAGLAHPFFDELREEGAKLPNGRDMPPLFDFTRQELEGGSDIVDKILPAHARDGGGKKG